MNNTHNVATSDVIGAIQRANAGELSDGTYVLSVSWIGNARILTAHHVSEVNGFEVAYEAVGGGYLHQIQSGEVEFFSLSSDAYRITGGTRIGAWTDPEGNVCVDRTIHVQATAGVALDIGRLYGQAAIWDWAAQVSIPTSDTRSAL